MVPVRRHRRGVALTSTLVLLVGVAAWLGLRPHPAAITPECTATAGSNTFAFDPDQAANATTIAEEARREGMPPHAVSVGLAAALQESKLHNLDYGDRDSLGLFQQRPSQGWGTPAQLLQPQYAAAAFFHRLRKVHDWQSLPIYLAAQRVQRSAEPAAYAYWDTESRTLARGLTGETPAGFTCRYPPVPRADAGAERALRTDVAAALGADALAATVTPSRGWLVASWLISRAPAYSLERVRFAGWTWTPSAKAWQRDAHAQPGGVTFGLRPAR